MQFFAWLARRLQSTVAASNAVHSYFKNNIHITTQHTKTEVVMQAPITRQNFDQWILPVYAPADFIPVRATGSRLYRSAIYPLGISSEI